jgi:hypothetical protein
VDEDTLGVREWPTKPPKSWRKQWDICMVDQVGTGVDRQAERYAAHALRTFINYDLTNESMLAAMVKVSTNLPNMIFPESN